MNHTTVACDMSHSVLATISTARVSTAFLYKLAVCVCVCTCVCVCVCVCVCACVHVPMCVCVHAILNINMGAEKEDGEETEEDVRPQRRTLTAQEKLQVAIRSRRANRGAADAVAAAARNNIDLDEGMCGKLIFAALSIYLFVHEIYLLWYFLAFRLRTELFHP